MSIRIESRSFSNTDVSHVAKLKDLDLITINETKITDDGLLPLSDLPNLKYLVLRGNTQLNGVGFANWKGKSKLETLTLSRCPITDKGLNSISLLESLVSLNLIESRITDDGLKQLKTLRNLENLWLSKTKISNSGIKNIVILPKIRSVFLSKTMIDDGCLESIAALQSLILLDVSDTNISDKSVDQIKKIKQLKVLKIQKTKITAEGFRNLADHFPKALIESDHNQNKNQSQCAIWAHCTDSQ